MLGNDEGRPPQGVPAYIEALRPTEPPTSSDSTPDNRQSINYAAALNLAAAGWRVFPCRHLGLAAKAPLTLNGHLDATTDHARIVQWWTRWPYAMIGAAVPDSLLVIDIDPRNGGSIEALTELVGVLPDTLTAWSGRNDGGRHLYYLRPPGPLTSTRLPEGIDLKANGYCIVPPSIHPATGLPYRWDELPPVSLPVRLRELLRPTPRSVSLPRGTGGNGGGLVRTVAEAPERKRHNALVWAAFRARDDGILDEITEDLVAAAVAAGGETETSARRVVASIRRTIS